MIRLKELRESRRLSQIEVAAQINKSFQAYSHYETGKREPDLATMNKLADFFNVSIDYLLGRDTEIKAEPPTKREMLIEKFASLTDEELVEMEQIADYIKSKKTKNQDAATIETTA